MSIDTSGGQANWFDTWCRISLNFRFWLFMAASLALTGDIVWTVTGMTMGGDLPTSFYLPWNTCVFTCLLAPLAVVRFVKFTFGCMKNFTFNRRRMLLIGVSVACGLHAWGGILLVSWFSSPFWLLLYLLIGYFLATPVVILARHWFPDILPVRAHYGRGRLPAPVTMALLTTIYEIVFSMAMVVCGMPLKLPWLFAVWIPGIAILLAVFFIDCLYPPGQLATAIKMVVGQVSPIEPQETPQLQSASPLQQGRGTRTAAPQQDATPNNDQPQGDAAAKPTHSDDFTSVNWFGTHYTFAKGQQAQAVKVLYEQWEKGGHGLAQESIAEKIGSTSNQFRLAKVFHRSGGQSHFAWGTMIQRAGKGIYKLASPDPQ